MSPYIDPILFYRYMLDVYKMRLALRPGDSFNEDRYVLVKANGDVRLRYEDSFKEQRFSFQLEIRRRDEWIPLFSIRSPTGDVQWLIVPNAMEANRDAFASDVVAAFAAAWPELAQYVDSPVPKPIRSVPAEQQKSANSTFMMKVIHGMAMWFSLSYKPPH